MNDLLTTGEAAAVLGLAPRTVTRYCELGLIHGEKRGRDWWIARVEVDRYGRERKAPGRPAALEGASA